MRAVLSAGSSSVLRLPRLATGADLDAQLRGITFIIALRELVVGTPPHRRRGERAIDVASKVTESSDRLVPLVGRDLQEIVSVEFEKRGDMHRRAATDLSASGEAGSDRTDLVGASV